MSASNLEQRTETPMEDTDGPEALWPGDPGQLPYQVRQVLVRLIQGPYVSQQSTPNLWSTLLANRAVVCSRMADLFLDLALDEERGVAFARSAPSTETPFPALMRKVPLSFTDTALLLYLRQLLLKATSQSERAYVGLEEILDHMQQYRSIDDADHALMNKRVRASVERMLKYNLLAKLEDPSRFEILPILALLITADVVSGLEAEYQAAVERANAKPGQREEASGQTSVPALLGSGNITPGSGDERPLTEAEE